jgi:putative tryptophan/tyrosine transport system substrate-binding protein
LAAQFAVLHNTAFPLNGYGRVQVSRSEGEAVRRREFITLLGGTAVAWPIAARAQQPERMRRVGVLTNVAADDPEGQARHTAFIQGLQELGWSDGHNVRLDVRWGAGDRDSIRSYAAELVALAPDVILAISSPTVAAAYPHSHGPTRL